MKMIDDLSMAHDNLHRELADIKRLIGKDKHALIKANIALNKRVQELEEERDEWKNTAQSYYMTNQELREQNKRYREALDIMLYHADNEEVIRDVYGTFVGKAKGR